MNNVARGFAFLTLILTAFICAETKANDLPIRPFEAVYDMYRQGDKLGSGSRSLTTMGDNTYSIELNSKMKWLIFSDKRKESSLFRFLNNEIQPVAYNYERTGTGKDKSLIAEFKSDKSLVVSPKAKKNASPEQWFPGLLDEMTLHIQVQLDLIAGKKRFEYEVLSNSGKLKKYELEVIGNEIISTGQGRFNAIKVARVYDKKKFYAQHAWFIPELNYTLARMWRMKKGVEQYDLVLNNYTPTENPN